MPERSNTLTFFIGGKDDHPSTLETIGESSFRVHLDTTTIIRGSAKRNAAFTLQHWAMLTTRQPEGCVPVVVSRCAPLFLGFVNLWVCILLTSASTLAAVAASPAAIAIPTPSDIASGTNSASFVSRPAQSVFEVQLALARIGISPGSLDGLFGPKTRLALLAFQQKENLPAPGVLDESTKSRLLLATPPFTSYTVTSEDLSRLRPLGKTWLEKSQQDRLDYEAILELVAEKAESHPRLIQQLNPSVDWTNLLAGTLVTLPNVEPAPFPGKAAFARIHLESRTLQVLDEGTNLLAHFPCSIAAFVEKRPVGELHVVTVALSPNYTFDPENFPESAEARDINRKLVLAPGPNNPVGTVWVGLDKPGYGIHGTPRPEQVGRAESHGCFRLANWNAEFFARLVRVGMPVFVEP